ncbi:MAG: hypothetical protein PHG66_06845 [Candidatus Colwellbacteria bacterium]|nr:hypothetical protein [Candidatus Colwellbacteria bacterium]
MSTIAKQTVFSSDSESEKPMKRASKKDLESEPMKRVNKKSESESEKPMKKEKKPKAPVSPTPSNGSGKRGKAILGLLTEKETEDLLNLEEDDDFSKSNKLYLGLTKVTTEKLEELFGERETLEWEDEEFKDKRYCYRISIGKRRFVLFDMINEESDDEEWDSDDEIEWYAMGDGGLRTLNGLMNRKGKFGLEVE